MVRSKLTTWSARRRTLTGAAILLACLPAMAQRTGIALRLESAVVVRWEERRGVESAAQELPRTDSRTYVRFDPAVETGQYAAGVRAYAILNESAGRIVKIRLDPLPEQPDRLVVLVHTF